MTTKAEQLKERTAQFASDVVRLVRQLPQTVEARTTGRQLISAATSVAANYRAACKARSHAEFLSKMGIVVEEADESLFWLEFLIRAEIASEAQVRALRSEANQLTAIFVASHRTASARHRAK
jgi:four helix bundle protein